MSKAIAWGANLRRDGFVNINARFPPMPYRQSFEVYRSFHEPKWWLKEWPGHYYETRSPDDEEPDDIFYGDPEFDVNEVEYGRQNSESLVQCRPERLD